MAITKASELKFQSPLRDLSLVEVLAQATIGDLLAAITMKVQDMSNKDHPLNEGEFNTLPSPAYCRHMSATLLLLASVKEGGHAEYLRRLHTTRM